MALDVKVKISLSSVGGVVGFGVPLILVSSATKAIAFNEYTDAESVSKAGYDTTSAAYKAFQLMKMQTNSPEKIAIAQVTDKAAVAIPTFEGRVRQVVTLLAAEGDSSIKEVADAIETTGSMTYFPVVANQSEASTLSGYDRTMVGVHSETATQAIGAALVGATAGYDAGSFTYKNMKLKGVTPDDIGEGDLTAIDTANMYTIAKKAGDIVTTGGKAISGEYLDVTDAFDWITQNIRYGVQKLLNSSPKVAYTNAGIGAIEAVVIGVLKQADRMGVIAHNDADEAMYSTNFATRAETTEAERAARAYTRGNFSFSLAGAIHTAEINGVVTV